MKSLFRCMLITVSGAALHLMTAGSLVAKRQHADKYHDDMFSVKELENDVERLLHIDELEAKAKEAESAVEHMLHRPARKPKAEVHALRERWHEYSEKKEARHEELGRYAHLMVQPAWPQYLQQSTGSNLLALTGTYDYATQAYNGSYATVGVFDSYVGKQNLQVRDLLLASDLVAKDKVTQWDDGLSNYRGGPLFGQNFYLFTLANDIVRFHARHERYGVDLALTKYFWGNRIGVGVNVPVVYVRHRLQAKMDILNNLALRQFLIQYPGLAYDGRALVAAGNDSNGNIIAARLPNAFLVRYGNDDQKFLQDVFAQKGMRDIGGSTSGFGDVSLFAQMRGDFEHLSNALAGVNLTLPTAQSQSMAKLWAPELGNGGFVEGKLFAAVSAHHNACLNPHLMVDVSYGLPAHVNRRVPRHVVVPADAARDRGLTETGMAFGDHVVLPAGRSIDAFEASLRGISDTWVRCKLYKGMQLNARVGNVFENFLSRRGFLDVYYNFRAKVRDDVMGLPASDYDIEAYRRDSAQLEHKIGGEFDYQFSGSSRVRLGINYNFAGMNVDRNVQLLTSLQYSF